MKKLINLFMLAIIIIVSISCNDDAIINIPKHPLYCFCLINKTGHNVLLETIYTDSVSKQLKIENQYEISPNDSSFFYQDAVCDTMPHLFQFSMGILDVMITYDSISILFVGQNPTDKFDIRNKYSYKKEQKKYIGDDFFSYTLTEADYQYALEHREGNE